MGSVLAFKVQRITNSHRITGLLVQNTSLNHEVEDFQERKQYSFLGDVILEQHFILLQEQDEPLIFQTFKMENKGSS